MKTIRIRTRVASILSAILLLFQISPALAFGLQGASQNHQSHKHQSFEVTFTKWITGPTPSGTLLMAGFNGGGGSRAFCWEQRSYKRRSRRAHDSATLSYV